VVGAADLDGAYPWAAGEGRYGRVCVILDLETGDLHYTSNLSGALLAGVLSMASVLVCKDTYGMSVANRERVALQGVVEVEDA
jgi:hypothetical protein